MNRKNEAAVRITVVGSLNMDLFLDVARLPLPGETILASAVRREPGGKGANQACAAAAMGARVRLIGAVGEDAFGKELRSLASRRGVDCRSVRRDRDLPTGIASIVLAPGGANHIVVAPGANAGVSRKDLDQANDTFGARRALIVQLESPRATVREALRRAQAVGMLTVLNPAPCQDLSDGFLRHCDWIILNEIEASQLSGVLVRTRSAVARAARSLRDRSRGRGVLITLGADGAWLDATEGCGHIPGFQVRAIDTVGAGDTFIGTFVTRLLEGGSAATAARFACAAAALAVTRRGAQASIPTRAQVEKMAGSDKFGLDVPRGVAKSVRKS